jgi:hypothetical protein
LGADDPRLCLPQTPYHRHCMASLAHGIQIIGVT